MHFWKSNINIINPNLTLFNENLEYKNTTRYLGVILDNKLSWIPHIKGLRATCSSKVNLLKYLANHGWGADRDTLMKVFKSLIRSKIEYGCTAYSSASEAALKILNPIYNSIRLVIGAYHTSPIPSLYCESGELPPEYQRKLILGKYAIKMMYQINHINHKITKNPPLELLYEQKSNLKQPYPIRSKGILNAMEIICDNLIENSTISSQPWRFNTDSIDTSLHEYHKSTTDPIVYRSQFHYLLEKYHNPIEIYTDGSKSDLGTACAFYSSIFSDQFKLNNEASIFSAELFAIERALLFIQTRVEKKFIILTDSLSGLEALKNIYSKHEKIKIIQNISQNLKQNGYQISFMWIPSHIGIKGNEYVDRLASEANESQTRFSNEISVSELINLFKRAIYSKWSSEWINTTNNKLRNNKNHTLKYQFPSLRRDQVYITRILIGHSKLTHEHKIKKENQPICQRCNTELSIIHILYECSRFTSLRRYTGIDRIQNLTDKTTADSIAALLKYIKSTQLHLKL